MEAKTPHLLIVRLSAMGDVAMMAHAVRAVRQANPDLRITLMTRAFFMPFFRDIPGLELLAPDLNGKHKGVRGLVGLAREIEALGVTHMADLHNVLRTKVLRVLLGFSLKKISVIDKGRSSKRALTRKHRKLKAQLKHTVTRYCEAISRAGFEVAEPLPVVRKVFDIPEQIAVLVPLKKEGDKWIGVAPFAQHKGKIYPSQKMDEAISLLSHSHAQVFIFGGGPYEQEFAEAMESRYDNVVSVIGRIKLDAELDLISNLNAMVCMDSSAMHMASLMGVPAISIWGATHPFAGFYGFGQDPQNAVQLDIPCRPCSIYGNKPCMYKDYRCLQGIPPEAVHLAVCRLTDNLGIDAHN